MNTVELTRDQENILKAMRERNDELSYSLATGNYCINGFKRFFTQSDISKLVDKRLIRRVRHLNGVLYYQLTEQGAKQ